MFDSCGHPVSRRRLLRRISCAGGFGLSLPELLARRATAADPGHGFGAAKSCIVLYCWGGISQLESWDPKPDAPTEVRGEYQAIATKTPGVQFGEYMPKLAQQSERLTVVRSCRHRARDHRQAVFWTLTGVPPVQLDGVMVSNPVLPTRQDKPTLGSMIGYVRNVSGGMPAAVTLPYPLAERGLVGGQHAGFLGVSYDPLVTRPEDGTPFPGVSPASVPLSFHDDPTRTTSRRELLESLQEIGDVPSRFGADWDRFHNAAMGLLGSRGFADAFELDQEPESRHEAYGRHLFGQSVLLARRLTEAGVPFVTVNCGAGDLNGGVGAIWDTHFFNFPQLKQFLMPPFDQAASALLDDLAERGALDETLVVFLTEFGRQPRFNQAAGRDHHPDCYSVAFAGGGIAGGRVYGSSDKFAAEVVDGSCGPADLHATIFHALGIDGDAELPGPGERRMQLTDGHALPLFG